MERKIKVSSQSIIETCEKLQENDKNVTVSKVINMVGGSFSTVGPVVKEWRVKQAANKEPLLMMPDAMNDVMIRATHSIWTAASELADDKVKVIEDKTQKTLSNSKAEMSEYTDEIFRLENTINDLHDKIKNSENQLAITRTKIEILNNDNTSLTTRLSERDDSIYLLRKDYIKLNEELLCIAKGQNKTP